jgi:beta-hydroxylase
MIDFYASKRHPFAQLRSLTLVSAPLNAAVHLGTPIWLQQKLKKSGILSPIPQIFPNLLKLREYYPIIREEALQAFKVSKPIKNDMFFTGLADAGWKRFYIKWYGPPDPLALEVCPQTVQILQEMPEVHLAMFSILMPGSKIPPHYGPTRMCFRYHMGISVPSKDCFIKVNGEKYEWENGKDVIFDDTFMHTVANNSTEPRIILFLDIERPQTPFFKPLNKAMIKYLGPLTTRANETQEKVKYTNIN